jgi:hypothetical protein
MRILAYDYKIVGTTTAIADSTYMGRHDSYELTIYICTGMQKQHRESTMIHEIIEAINWQLKLGLKEKQIIGLESGLYDVFRNTRINMSPLMQELDNKK